MDDAHFITKLSAQKLLPGNTDSQIKALSTQADKAMFFLSSVIKPALDIAETSNFNQLLSAMEKCGYTHVQKLAVTIKQEVAKTSKRKPQKSGNPPSKVTYGTSRKKNSCSPVALVSQSSHQGTSNELFDDYLYSTQKRQCVNPFSTYPHSQSSFEDPNHSLMAYNYGPTTLWRDPPIYFDCEQPSSSLTTKTRKPPQKAKKATSCKKKNGSSTARSSRQKTSEDDEESLEEALEYFGFGPAPSRPHNDELFDYPTSRAVFSIPGSLHNDVEFPLLTKEMQKPRKPPQKAKKATSCKKKNGSSTARSSRQKTSEDDEESLEEALEYFGFGPAPSRPHDDELFDYPTSRAVFSRPGSNIGSPWPTRELQKRHFERLL